MEFDNTYKIFVFRIWANERILAKLLTKSPIGTPSDITAVNGTKCASCACVCMHVKWCFCVLEIVERDGALFPCSISYLINAIIRLLLSLCRNSIANGIFTSFHIQTWRKCSQKIILCVSFRHTVFFGLFSCVQKLCIRNVLYEYFQNEKKGSEREKKTATNMSQNIYPSVF